MAKGSNNNNLEILHQNLDRKMRYSSYKSKFDRLSFSKGLDERLSMTATAKQHWPEAVKIAAKAFLAAHKLPPSQQTIT
eukprot:7017838-Ditylum_brightwellii.AAC.1